MHGRRRYDGTSNENQGWSAGMHHPPRSERGQLGSWRRAFAGAALGLIAGLAKSALAAGLGASAGQIQVITSPDRGNVQLDRPALLAIFMMRVRQWPDGTPVHVFVLPAHNPIHDRFARERLGTYPYVLTRTWDRIVFTGTGLAPEIVGSEQEMREKVMKTPGAIGYLAGGRQSDAGTVRVGAGSPTGVNHDYR